MDSVDCLQEGKEADGLLVYRVDRCRLGTVPKTWYVCQATESSYACLRKKEVVLIGNVLNS